MQVPRLALSRDLRGNPRAYTWALTTIPDVPNLQGPCLDPLSEVPSCFLSVTQCISYTAFIPT